MESAVQEPETQQPEPPEPPVERPCPSCGAALAPDQEWCLECGAPTGERRGRPGWRTAGAVVGATLVLAGGAAAAAYAAIDQGNQAPPPQHASAPPATTPDTSALPPAITTPPAATTPTPADTATPKPSKNTPPAAPAPPVTATPVTPPAAPAPPVVTPPATPSTPQQSGGDDSKAPSKDSGDKGDSGKDVQDQPTKPEDKPLPPPEAIALDPTAASVYNPAELPAESLGDATLTLDDKALTAWTLQLPENAGAKHSAGVLLALGDPTGVRRLDLLTSTPGISIEVYGTTHRHAPATLDDDQWELLATQLDVQERQRISLGDGSQPYRQVLVWVSEGPADGSSTVSLSELQLLG